MKVWLRVAVLIGMLAVASRGVQAGTVVPVGTEFLINTYTTGAQDYPAMCGMSDGGFVVVWGGGEQVRTEIFGQRYASDGGKLGTEFQVNTYTTDEQERPAICCNDSGGFVVVWRQEKGQDGDNDGLFAQRFASDGDKAGTEFQVNTYTTDDQTYPTICCNAGGAFIVSWVSYEQDGDRYGIFAQRFSSSGLFTGTEFQVNTYTTGAQLFPAIACAADGAFTIAWQSNALGTSTEVVAQRFASDGTFQGDEFQVNTYTEEAQDHPTICNAATGDFVVAWRSSGQDGSSDGVFGQRFTSAGVPRGTEFQVPNTSTLRQAEPSASCDPDGDFTVAWESNIAGGGYAIYARRFADSGAPQEDEVLVNFPTIAYQKRPVTVRRDDESFVVVWEDFGKDGNGFGIFGRSFALPSPTASATHTSTSTPTLPAPTATATRTSTLPPPTATATTMPSPTRTPPAATATRTGTRTHTATISVPTTTATTVPSPTRTLPAATATRTGTRTHTATISVPTTTATTAASPTLTLPAATVTHTATVPVPTTTAPTVPSPTVTFPAATATRTSGATAIPTDTPVARACVGDCDDSRTVTVNELVRGVNIALEKQNVDTCKAFDSNDDNAVTVEELVQGVRSLLSGCVGGGASFPPNPRRDN